MAKDGRIGTGRAPAAMRLRVAKHIASLGCVSLTEYQAWCRRFGFDTGTDKSAAQIEVERHAHEESLRRARQRLRVARDPRRIVEAAFAGELRAADVLAPQWRVVCERIDGLRGGSRTRESLRELALAVLGRAGFLGDTETFGERTGHYFDALVELNRRRSQWIRPLETWRPRSHNRRRQFASLARHLLCRHPVPGFMDAAWLRRDREADRHRDWFVLIGAGENPRRGRTPIPMTKRMAHAFLQAPDHYDVEGAVRWGQVHALGGDARLCDAVVSTRLGRGFEHEDFWVSVLRFFVDHPMLDRRHVGPIVDYLHSQRFESRAGFVAPGARGRLPPPQPNLSMRGRSVRTLLAQVDRWHRELGRQAAGHRLSWEPCGVGGLEAETGIRGRSLKVWRIRELLTSDELHSEGRLMRHCVASYAHSCAAGSCSIWAMEVESHQGVEKRQTVEVNANSVVVQCRGRFNALPTAQELEMLHRWAAEQRLQVSPHVRAR